VIAGAVLAGLLVTLVGLVGARFIRSPAQVAADAKPPAVTELSAKVEKRQLGSSVVAAGKVEPDQVAGVKVIADSSSGRAAFTRVNVTVGAAVRAGQVLAEVSGRPLAALPGAIPAYRDLTPGLEGVDVEQLQAAMDLLGHATSGDRRGSFGPRTAGAVTGFYKDIGYAAPTVGDDEVKAATAAATGAKRTLEQAQSAVKALAPDADPAARAGALTQLRYAKEDSATAQSQLTDAKAKSGPKLPASEVAFVPALPAVVAKVTAVLGQEPPSGEAFQLSGGALVVRAAVNPADATSMKKDQVVRVITQDGRTLPAKVRDVGSAPVKQEGAQDQPATVPVTCAPDSPIPDDLRGQDTRVVVTTSATAGPVLVVPMSAVATGADGQPHVTVLGPGPRHAVAVTLGFAGDGYVEVIQPDGGQLHEGDDVLLGSATAAPVATAPAG